MSNQQSNSVADTGRDRANERNALLSGFLGWTFDAFDFFILVMALDVVGEHFGRTRPEMALTLTASLAMRPVGALIFGIMADRFGRRLPLILNIIFFSLIEVLSGLAPNYTVFFILRLLYGIGMGGEWGVGASLALESVPAKWRGILSGLIQEGYALGYLLAAAVYFLVYPQFDPRYGWRILFFIGGLPALLSLFVRAKVKEPEAWRQTRTDWTDYRRKIFANWPRFLYIVLLMMFMNGISHGSQDLYPTYLKKELLPQLLHPLQGQSISILASKMASRITIFSMIGAIIGGIVVGRLSDRIGRRKAMVLAIVGALCFIPFWVNVRSLPLVFCGAFLLQFMIQGAWGVIPAHINELSPNLMRGFFPGFAYQVGVLCASGINPLEAKIGETIGYAHALAYCMIVIMSIALFVIGFGPENKGVHFGAKEPSPNPIS